ncbi:NRDE family protein [Rubellicoccus peritrichatus]|uniref:NRDE family protein n=1 Tax=Rubellicoccus peritrichatus TaxID=3080537 RepID=A0AAQ3LEQ9_9BACT|nr:NRDE family protein [Puniceicoccus sp. CR14]WOO40564.1 NRDE family protein [Puniceicoccus sp. CR14]
MCTATWWSDSARYELFFSRDERKDRSPGIEPKLHSKEGVKYICPRDPDGGGTWILVNEYGLTVSLLNQYPESPAPMKQPRISRGRLVELLASCRDIDSVTRKVELIDLAHYEGFLLMVIEPGNEGCLYRWDTHSLSIDAQAKASLPVTSSSFMSDEVIEARRKLFADMVAGNEDPSSEKLREFHHYSMPEAASHSVFMQRDDSETVSLCQIEVGPEAILMSYQPKQLGEKRFGQAVTVRLTPHACLV